MAFLRHLLSILVLPATVTVVVPFFILRRTFSAFIAQAASSPPDWLTWLGLFGGLAFIACGLRLVGGTIRRFATEGQGTLAPWDPPRRLVVTGVYRFVRNPMISGVLMILLGEATVLRSLPVLEWAITFFAINAIYMPLFEEPGLARRFGEDYAIYRQNVPRWIPRTTAWEAPWSKRSS